MLELFGLERFMRIKASNIYVIIFLIFVYIIRNQFDFVLGDRDAFLSLEWQDPTVIRNRLTALFFGFGQVFSEILICFLYYRNILKLSHLLVNLSPLRYVFNINLLYYSILFSFLAPVSILLSSFAGKDLLGAYISSSLCIDMFSMNSELSKSINYLKLFKTISFLLLLFIIREMTAFFLLLLYAIFFIYYSNKINFKIITLLSLSVIPILYQFKDNIYNFLLDKLIYQWYSAQFTDSTFAVTHLQLTLNNYFNNYYQAFTGVNEIHLGVSLFKSLAILFNCLLLIIPSLSLNLIYWTKAPSVSKYLNFKIIFILIYFSLYAYFSQINPAGAVRFFSSIVPIIATFSFFLIPSRKYI